MVISSKGRNYQQSFFKEKKNKGRYYFFFPFVSLRPSSFAGGKREEKVVVSSFVFAIGKRKSPPKVE
jgi:hypothetical protein